MQSHSKVVYSLFVMSALLVSSMAVFAPGTISASAASSSCTAANTFRLTFYPPATSLNYLGAFSTANSRLEDMMWFPLFPASLPTGQPLSNLSVTDIITHNANYTVWQFHVRPGLMWSDGTPVSANDILTTYGPTFGLNASNDVLSLAPTITKAFAVNSSTAEFDLNQPNAYLPTDLRITIPEVYSASMIQKDGVNSNFFNNPIVDGPWVASNFTQGSTQMVLTRNPYFKPTTAVCQIDISFTEVEGLDTAQVQSGATDLAEITFATASSVQSLPNIHLLDEKAALMQDIQYNVTLYPFNMTSFRQAIVYGINDSAIIQSALNGYAVDGYSAQGTIPSTLSLYYNPNQAKYSYNPDKAVSLLNSIGITGGNGAPLKYPNGTKITLTLVTDTSKSFDVTSASVISANLESIGFNVVTNTMSQSAMFGLPSVYGGEMILFSTGAPDFSNPFYDAVPGWDVYSPVTIVQNYWEWPQSVNTEYNNNLTALEATADPTQVAHYLNNIQAINAVNLPSIITCYPDDLFAYSTANWANWTPYPQGFISMYTKFDVFEIANLVPASQASSSTQSTTTSNSGVTSTGTQTTSISTQTTGSASSSSSIAISASYWLVLAAASIVLVALSFGYLFARRRPEGRVT